MNDTTKLHPLATAAAAQLPAEWTDKLKDYAVAARVNEVLSGQFFSTKGGLLSFAGQAIPNNTMDVVVAASLHENVLYVGDFDPGNIGGPVCYAFSPDGGPGMAPHPNAPEPRNVDCKTCPNNAWGSDPKGGRGKACKNMRRLSLLPAAALDSPAALDSAVSGYLRVPVTSVKPWAQYVNSLSMRGLPPFAVVTRVTLTPDAKTMFKMSFTSQRAITDAAMLEALAERVKREAQMIDFPYPDGGATPAATPVPPPPVQHRKF